MLNLTNKATCFQRLLNPGRKMPVYLLAFVTNRCNAACEHCFYWEQLNTKVREELSVDEYDRLAKSFGPMFQVTFTGGSPELRRDLPEIVERFYHHCRPTNMTFCMLGQNTSRIVEHAEKMLTKCPNQKMKISISLDGLEEEHDQLRKLPGLFPRVVETCQEIGKLKKHYPNLRLDIGITVHGLNYETAERTALWARQNLPIDVLKPILVRGNPLNPDTLDAICKTSYMNVIRQDVAWVTGAQGGRFSPFDYLVNAKEKVQREIISEISATGKVPVTCAGGRETAVMYPTGDVAGCELRDITLGNVRDVDFDFRKIWFNEAADEFRETSGKAAECQGCYHHCFLSPAVFRTPKLWWRMVRVAMSIYRNQSLTV